MDSTARAHVDAIVRNAVEAHRVLRRSNPRGRAQWIQAVADSLDGAEDELLTLAEMETHLAKQRLRAELKRTTFQLRSFAQALTEGSVLGAVIDVANPNHPIVATPDLRRMLIAMGPVIVFAASNFPFAFSVAGGDTASAWAAGCPVIVKAHSGHPQLSDAVSHLINETLRSQGAPAGMFALVHSREDGIYALNHPDIAAASFTGSLEVGQR